MSVAEPPVPQPHFVESVGVAGTENVTLICQCGWSVPDVQPKFVEVISRRHIEVNTFS